MRRLTVVLRRFICIFVVIGMLFFSTVIPVLGEETSPPANSAETLPSVPSLSDVVYQAGSLGQRLDVLKTRIDAVDGLRKMEQRLEQAKKQTDLFHNRLKALTADDLQSYQQLVALKGEVRGEGDAIDQLVETLAGTIREVESRRRNWLAEKNRWDQWRLQLGADLSLNSVANAFERAKTDIDQALDIISRKLEPLLEIQQKAGDIGSRINGLINQMDAIMAKQRGGSMRGGTPTMFSAGYLRQLIDLTLEPGKIVNLLPPPDPSFFSKKSWVIGLQSVVFVLLFSLLRRNRALLLVNADRRFLGKRQVAVSGACLFKRWPELPRPDSQQPLFRMHGSNGQFTSWFW